MRKRRPKPRRGVVLLVILSLLVLFMLMAVTFVIISFQYRNAATMSARTELVGNPIARHTDNVLYQVVRGTNGRSSLRKQSLLGDYYGDDSIYGDVAAPITTQAGGQFLKLGFTNATGTFISGGKLSNTPDAYVGCVLTMLDGPAKGHSTWIVDYVPTIPAVMPNPSIPGFFRVEAFTSDTTSTLTPNANDQFLINGRPFNGTGHGYDHRVGFRNIDNFIPQTIGPIPPPPALPLRKKRPVALLPHFIGYSVQPPVAPDKGGADESYDAPDYQNMFLALVPPGQFSTANPPPPYWPLPPYMAGQPNFLAKWKGTSPTASISPSFHRPALVNYWINQMVSDTVGLMAPQMPWDPTATALYPASSALSPSTRVPIPDEFIALSRMFLFRPMPWDHPGFDGGNLHFRPDLILPDLTTSPITLPRDPALFWSALINGPWDVDNDGDGVTDSIWIDVGLPVATSKDGKLYKPLAAILIKDLDGRLNVNAHGNLVHLNSLYMDQTSGALAPVSLSDFAGPAAPSTLPRGQGFGPSGVSLGPLFINAAAEHSAILTDRYGSSAVPGVTGDDPSSEDKSTGLPDDYVNQDSSYGSPPDTWDRGITGLDHRGQPQTFYQGLSGEATEDPYEKSMSQMALFDVGAKDSPYNAAEIERLLRWADADSAMLPDRLLSLAPATYNSSSFSSVNREITTTLSSHNPAPNVSVPSDYRGQLINQIGRLRSLSLIDLYRARLLAGIPLPAMATPAQVIARLNTINLELDEIVPFEIRHGQKFDLSRLFGNGEDDNSNGVVDEHWRLPSPLIAASESAGTEFIWSTIEFDHDNDGVAINDSDAYLARYHYAKHLYCLMMLLKGPGNPDFLGDGSPSDAKTAQVIAQWAINVVDFRDADAIMTPFEYDIHPWNGWGVDGNIDPAILDPAGADRRLVWGCERPELLISETFALHDRRTEDLAIDPSGDTKAAGDLTSDQRLRPRGSFFVELYNPWSGDSKRPAEFYRDSSNVAQNGVVLNKFNTASNGDETPVWRMIVVKGGSHAGKSNPDTLPTPQSFINDIDRTIYFTPIPGRGPVQGQTYLSNRPMAPLLPGRYAVVGSSNQSQDDTGAMLDLDGDGVAEYVTTIGRKTGWAESVGMLLATGLDYPNTRRIVLEPSTDPNSHQVRVENNNPASLAPGTDIQSAIAVVINRVWDTSAMPAVAVNRSLNITEPVAGYPATINSGLGVWNPDAADYEGAYETMPVGSGVPAARDAPFDTATQLTNDNPVQNYRTLHLQRLANPLEPYHARYNPYRTIDTMAVPMHSYDGVESAGSGTPKFKTHFRGENDPASLNRLLWDPGLTPGTLQPNPGMPTNQQNSHVFEHDLAHTLGFLNQFYRPVFNSGNPPPTAAYLGAPDTIAGGQPFPWLNWTNRPFANPMEIMQVPTTSSYNLPRKFATTRGYTAGGLPYELPGPVYGHLLNFFQTDDAGGDPTTHFYRLFDVVETPSPFVGAERWYRPQTFRGTASAGTGSFHPPFNKLSRFRDAGLTNINTIFNNKVWLGHTKGFPNHNSTAKWNEVVASRRGYGATAAFGSHYALNTDYPTRFANPFRSAAGADFLPDIPVFPRPNDNQINATLLRHAPDSTDASADADHPLFQYGPSEKHHNTGRNPAFHFQGMQRLSNTLTTHSNVFAIWITIGNFEVTAGAIDTAHHDGYRLGQELDVEVGGVKRHRGFYIVDRSIPVAFDPGENHNVDRAILVRRIIE